ncbi:MAG: 6-phosphofructokinase, partial [Armatimonadota bacterium]|nr:6-phosphofructokinase [Armatimonadota bacterium]
TGRWYFVVAMGRTAGHLALGIGKTTGATITVIPEEFTGKTISLDIVCDALEGAILKRLAHNRDNGVAVIAEGIADKLDEQELLSLLGNEAPRDEAGHIRLAEVPIASILKRLVQERLKKRGMKMTIVDSTLGYELRCAPPIPFDREYTRDLGYGAVRHLLSDSTGAGSGAMMSIQNGCLVPIPFENILNPETGRTSVRTVNLDTDSYRVARAYMIRLERTDFDDPARLAALALAANTTPEEFRAQFGHLAGL